MDVICDSNHFSWNFRPCYAPGQLSSLNADFLVCGVKCKQSLSSHCLKHSNDFPKPTRSHTVSKEKTLNQPVGSPAPPTHSLPRLFPCLHGKNLPLVSSLLPGKQGSSFTCTLALEALSRGKSTFIHRTACSLHSLHFTISS